MEIIGDTISFKSKPGYFEIEKNGRKSNTVRLLDSDEARKIDGNRDNLKKIFITTTDFSDSFERKLTDISEYSEVFLPPEITNASTTFKRRFVFIFSWTHESELRQSTSPQ